MGCGQRLSRRNWLVPDELQTARLSMRPVVLADTDLLVELDSDPEVMRFLTGRASSRAEVQRLILEPAGCRWVAHHTETGEFVGWFGLVPGAAGTYDVGYRLRRRWWGHGLATEGTRAIIDAAFSSLDAHRVTAQTMAVNQRSRRVMERCGMRHVRTFHVEWEDPLPGTEEGEVEYELTSKDWARDHS